MAIAPDVVSHEQSYAREEKLNEATSQYGMTIDFDPEEIRKKYEAEKAKRDNNGGLGQYIRSKDVNIVHYDEDPYAKFPVERLPVDAIFDVVIVGAGYTGLQVAARLIENGLTSICIIEKGSGVGGTWYWNRYPGLQCDIESYIYMPLLEDVGSKPSRKYASGFELWQHADRIAEKFGLKDRILFQTIVSKMSWVEEDAHWKIDTNRGDNIRARWTISASGPFHAPKFPGVPGIEKFQGKSFHSCRWDYDYTGGSFENPTLDKLADKTVVIIGTGATAI
ncbi:uncharacterized protein N7479_005275 [Penicillium vulpinum]|uniref:FAD/NAD(P)-binding domain-containing protein n=1 Tax=Penicillium vulpinum TaxID=29845 RepID=A0A1V6RHG8_9EURO|nr:uncharacterized protein N7479_005275 [Penicillium vulpinum]KAJ5958125.1 hypothetical protein N7479_005275 [Penicillium vulpinum]OQE01267.1 hypothetical protein PENVUL_c043G00443 [Penicillium vulpinum]